MSTGARLVLLATVALIAGTAAARADEPKPTDLPRYHFQAGQEISFKGSSEFHFKGHGLEAGGMDGLMEEWTVWVVRKNDDGSWRLVIRQSERRFRKLDSPVLDRLRAAMTGERAEQQPPDVTLAYIDLFEDGRYEENPTLRFRLQPEQLFPRLPANADEMHNGWNQAGGFDEVTRCSLIEDGPETFILRETRESPMDKIYLSSMSAKVDFDRKAGLVGKSQGEVTQGYGFNGNGTTSVDLEKVTTKDDEWLAKFAAEADRYSQASAAYQKALDALEVEANPEPVLQKARDDFKAATESLTLPLFREQVEHQLTQLEAMKSYYIDGAKERSSVLGKPAAEWELKDLQDRTHSLDQYKGKVVVLDFWYRGCGWCIRAMPQMKQLAADFKDEPVAILGVNTDQDVKDAQFVVDAMELNYPVLVQAKDLPPKYKVSGFPTLVLIDRDGKVADVHVGYSKDLREKVGKSIRRLLEEK